jgi:RND superfamily putative drug exporter
VLFAGLTVTIALLGQFAIGLSFLDGLAVAAAATVALTMLASLTHRPAAPVAGARHGVPGQLHGLPGPVRGERRAA